MGTKSEDNESDKSQERTVGLYPKKKEKLVKPISVKADVADESSVPITDEKVDSEIKKTDIKSADETDTKDSMPKLKSSLDDADSDPEAKIEEDDMKADKDDVKESDADDNAAQVPDTEAALKTDFIDEGQYRITVPKRRKSGKSSALSKLLWLIFVLFLMALAGYLYVSAFGINLEDILDSIRELIGQ